MPVDPQYLHLVYQGPFPAFLYGRNSVDPRKKGRSVKDQIDTGRRLCDEHDWPIVDEFKDTGLSASRHARKKRKDFEEMLERIKEREARIVVAFEASRYYRDLEVYVQLRNACQEAGVLLCYNGTVFDLSKRADRKATAMDAVASEDELEGIRDRNLRTTQIWADKGAPHGPAPFGYRRNYDPDTGDLVEQVPHSEEAELVVGLFEARKAGKSKRAMAAGLNAMGRLSRGGKPWSSRAITMVLRNKAYIGIRSHRGTEHKATWQGIVTKELFYAVQALEDAERRRGVSTAVKYKYSGLPVCGHHEGCADRSLYSVKRTSTNRGRMVYRCNSLDTSVDAGRFEAYVDEAIFTWLGSPEAVAAFQKEDNSSQDVARARARLSAYQEQLREARELSRTFAPDNKPLLSSLSLSELERGLAPQIEEARQTIKDAQAQVPAVLQKLLGNPQAEEAFNALDIEQQRFVLVQIVTIRLFKARAPGVKRIEPGRVVLSFYGQPGFKAEQTDRRRQLYADQ
ncbi:recombinase family protein [Streptomyces sp. NBC_01216]|uniref:recombinase family protein n=1 Tax=Streptomyces sp. NBC_01216 TaxID=2903778 RepID=UPI002E1307B1|nr:recombinase family protein [Streptomyces sp. NBC_01216]